MTVHPKCFGQTVIYLIGVLSKIRIIILDKINMTKTNLGH